MIPGIPLDNHSIEYSIIGAIILAVLGYMKTLRKGKLEKFTLRKFTSTILIGAIIGAIMYFTKTNFNGAYQVALTMGLTSAIESAFKSIWRHGKRVKKRLRKLLKR